MLIVVWGLQNPVSAEYGPTPTIVMTVLAAVPTGIAFMAQEFTKVCARPDQLSDFHPRRTE